MRFFIRITLIFCMCLAFTNTAKALTSSFTASYTSGCAPLVVHFKNTSTGATSYSWDLGNGTFSTLKDPSGTYLLPGTYVVKLVASSGGSSITYTMTITVHPLPTISFFANDTSVCPGTNVVFTSTTIGGVPGPMTYTWNFGDGVLGSGSPVNHTYTTPGFYMVTLSVTNSTGCTNTLSIPSYMHVFTPPAINFVVSTAHFCSPPGVATFTNLTTGVPALTYAWDFGDGGTSVLTNPTHTYLGVGSYTVKLTAKDGNNCSNTLSIPAYVTVTNLIAKFTSVSKGCIGDTIRFTNTTTSYVSSNWDFGDGGTSIINNPTHVYAAAGPYNVRLIVFDGYCYDTVVQTVNINAGPVASFTQSPLFPCPPPVPLTFTSTTIPSTSTVKWSFGDGTTGVGTPVTHTYARWGFATITMIATDPATGCSDTATRLDTLYDGILEIIDTPTMGCKQLTVKFKAQILSHMPDSNRVPLGLYPLPPLSYIWNFGDGSALSTLPTPSHIYTAVGVYYASLTVTTAYGCTFKDTVKIEVGDPPTITAVIKPKHICFGDSINIPIRVMSGMADDYFWDFGPPLGKLESRNDSLFMYFPMPGVFTVTVTASHHGCMSLPFVLTDTMIVDSPQAKIAINYLCKPRTDVQFYNISLGANTFLWMFGDGTTSTVLNPVHTYPTLGKYTVKLATYNIRTGCRDTATEIIDLTPPVYDFVADKVGVCRDEPVRIKIHVYSGTIGGFEWYVDGIKITDTFHVKPGNVLLDTFSVLGFHTVMITGRDALGCLDTLLKKDYLTVAKPVARITVSPANVCRSSPVTFTDVSTDVPGVALTKFDWTFGDGATASRTTPVVTHAYTLNGSYSVKEIVTDAFGCKDTAYFFPIVVTRPIASFYASDTTPCAWDSIFFVNTSLDYISSAWDFGDGTTSTATSTWHTYKSAGNYTVRLIVTDASGCKDTAFRSNYITISKPTASFSMSDSFSVCPPLTVVFYNRSSGGAIAYEWYFGDGNTSTALYPSNLYTKVGFDTVLLIAFDGNGCTDTARGYVNLFGYDGAFSYSPLTGCSPLTVRFKANVHNVASIIWDFADGVTSPPSLVDSIVHVYTNPGPYVPKLVLSDFTGCQNSSMGLDTIKVNVIYPGFTTEPTPVCVNGIFNFKDTSRSYYATVTSWLWSFNNGDTSTLRSPSNTYTLAGTYSASVTVTDSWGCTASGKQDVMVLPPPFIYANPDTIVCLGDAATLTGRGGVSYTWAPAATVSCTNCNPTLGSPGVVTTYTVTGTDKFGCKNTNTTIVRLKTKTISAAFGDTTVCFGVVVPLSDSGATKFTWLPPAGLSDPTSGNPMASPDTTTNYMVIAQLGSCIPDTNFVKVTIHPVAEVDAGPDQTIVAGMSADIRATGTNIYSLSWGNDSTLSCNSCLNPKATPYQTTAYVIRVTSSFGCPSTDTMVINVYCDKSQLFVPNVFTPNGDGENDVFYPRGRGITMVKAFRIYNRWGQLMFERSNIQLNDETNAWDGIYMGEMARPDVYVYLVEAVCDAGDAVNIKGDVTIIR